MTGMRSWLVILTALLLSGSAAVAQQSGTPCSGDIETLCAGKRPDQSLHKIAHGSDERSLQGCDVPSCGGRKHPGRWGLLEIISRERDRSSEAKAGFDIA